MKKQISLSIKPVAKCLSSRRNELVGIVIMRHSIVFKLFGIDIIRRSYKKSKYPYIANGLYSVANYYRVIEQERNNILKFKINQDGKA